MDAAEALLHDLMMLPDAPPRDDPARDLARDLTELSQKWDREDAASPRRQSDIAELAPDDPIRRAMYRRFEREDARNQALTAAREAADPGNRFDRWLAADPENALATWAIELLIEEIMADGCGPIDAQVLQQALRERGWIQGIAARPSRVRPWVWTSPAGRKWLHRKYPGLLVFLD